ncbi:centrosomal protein of 104 kDa-like isoform X2 [Portunus trituberculatus]|nr:centrosomal protein of 104 kDa-like isoform X2 [Portunus trituberculatus]
MGEEEEDPTPPRRPPTISEADKKDAAPAIDVFGRELVEKVYSKNYSEKESGLKHLYDLLANYTPQETGVRPDRYIRAAVVMVRRGLRDKVFSVGQRAAHTLEHILSFAIQHKVSRKEVSAILDRALPDLLAKTTDNAPRTQQLASSAILNLLQFSLERGVGSVGVEVTRPVSNTVHPRAALCRAGVVEAQVEAMGVEGLPKEKESGFTVKHAIEFSHSAFRHQNKDVRKVGERLLLRLHEAHPIAVRRVLPPPEDIQRRSVHYRNLLDQMDLIDEKREAPAPQQGRGGSTPPHKSSTPNHPSTTTTPQHQNSRTHTTTTTTTTTISSTRGAVGGGESESEGELTPRLSCPPDEEVRGRALSRLNGSCLDLSHDLPSPSDPDDRTCIFCGTYNPVFTDEGGLDLHYWRACPMLTRCPHCRQVVEVAALTSHLLGECASSSLYQRCERCCEAIAKKVFQTHSLAKTCTPCRPEPLANHCPLCHANINPWDEGWRDHLLPGPTACPCNPRAWPGSKKAPGNSGAPSQPQGGRRGGGGAPGTPGTPRRNVSRRR